MAREPVCDLEQLLFLRIVTDAEQIVSYTPSVLNASYNP